MPVDLQETRLPGVGTKFTIRLAAGGRLSIILHNDGKRELYWFRRADEDEPEAPEAPPREREPNEPPELGE